MLVTAQIGDLNNEGLKAGGGNSEPVFISSCFNS